MTFGLRRAKVVKADRLARNPHTCSRVSRTAERAPMNGQRLWGLGLVDLVGGPGFGELDLGVKRRGSSADGCRCGRFAQSPMRTWASRGCRRSTSLAVRPGACGSGVRCLGLGSPVAVVDIIVSQED